MMLNERLLGILSTKDINLATLGFEDGYFSIFCNYHRLILPASWVHCLYIVMIAI